jgi:hypothetical protein
LFWLQADTPAAISNANTDFVTIEAFIFIVFILKKILTNIIFRHKFPNH